MSWFTEIFSSSVDKVVDSVGEAVDKLVTSDEERLVLQNELRKILGQFELQGKELANKYDSEITERHKTDMVSDSWLSKNIRPLSLAFIIINLIGMAWASIFYDLSVTQIQVLGSWITPLVGVAGTMITFYFGSRGWEKIKSISVNKERPH